MPDLLPILMWNLLSHLLGKAPPTTSILLILATFLLMVLSAQKEKKIVCSCDFCKGAGPCLAGKIVLLNIGIMSCSAMNFQKKKHL